MKYHQRGKFSATKRLIHWIWRDTLVKSYRVSSADQALVFAASALHLSTRSVSDLSNPVGRDHYYSSHRGRNRL